ncbi:MAG: hypothetical protein H6618_03480 [Deltaproteobacteria bacterium]|nr:hypothetical protein [Deltaproteobacteria bacterium]
MKIYLNVVAVLIYFWQSSLFASEPSSKVACVYTGSFDPLHKGHFSVMEIAHERKCQEVYVVAKRGFFSEKPDRRPWEIRYQMLQIALKDKGFIRLPKEDYPDLVCQLRSSGHRIIGIVGSDRAAKPSEDHRKLDVDEWFVVTRTEHENDEPLIRKNTLMGKPMEVFVVHGNGDSSTQVRHGISSGQDIASTAIMPEIISFVKEHKLYQASEAE